MGFTKRIIVLGMPDLGTFLLSRLHQCGVNIVAVLVPDEPAAVTAMGDMAQQLALPWHILPQTGLTDSLLQQIAAYQADLGLVCSCTLKLPATLLACTKDGFVNCHGSLLPAYRGANPFSWPIFDGAAESGVTLHYVDAGWDTGDIIIQHAIPLTPQDTLGTLFTQHCYLGATLLEQMLREYEQRPLQASPQPPGRYPVARQLRPEQGDMTINWQASAIEIERFVRGLNPFWGASTLFRGVALTLYQVTVMAGQSTVPAGGFECVAGDWVVATGEGLLRIDVLRVGSYVLCSGQDALTRFAPALGEAFE